MDAAQLRVRVVTRRHAPETFPCPHCGTRGQRKTTHTRSVRDIAYGEILFVEITVGEYRAHCSCCKTFRSQIPGIERRAEYTNRVRQAVIDRLLDDSMSMERLQQALARDFRHSSLKATELSCSSCRTGRWFLQGLCASVEFLMSSAGLLSAPVIES